MDFDERLLASDEDRKISSADCSSTVRKKRNVSFRTFFNMNSSNVLPRLCYTVKEVSIILGVNDKTVYRLLKRGHLKALKALRHKKITSSSIEDLLK